VEENEDKQEAGKISKSVESIADTDVREEEDENDKNYEDENGEFSKFDQQQLKNAPFRRVISEDVYVPNSLKDNSFEAKIGSRGDWGEKANLDLKHTKGKSFRHEKTKKKRGGYKGGNINTSVNSIKFDDSD